MKYFLYIIKTLLMALLLACASSSPTEVLDDALQETKAQEDQSPSLVQLNTVLGERGYQGVGLQYESEDTLALLRQVFEDEKTSNRRLKLVYTGLYMSYDKKAESLTVGGGVPPEKVVAFIAKNVPAKK